MPTQGETEYKDTRLKRLLELYRMKPKTADEFKSICVEISYWLTHPSLNSIRKQQQRRRNRERHAVNLTQTLDDQSSHFAEIVGR